MRPLSTVASALLPKGAAWASSTHVMPSAVDQASSPASTGPKEPPPITHMRLLNTSAEWCERPGQPASGSRRQVMPSPDDQTSLVHVIPESGLPDWPPISHSRSLKATSAAAYR